MSFIEEISWMSKSGYSDIELLEYIDKHFDEIECELNGEEYKEPKHNRNICIECNMVKTIDYSSIEHGGTRPFFYMVDQYLGNDSLEHFESKFIGSTGLTMVYLWPS